MANNKTTTKKPLLQALNKRLLGDEKERLAVRYLKRQGCHIVARNVSSPFGEIDVIARHKEYLCFVEVRYRKNRHYGGAALSVGPSKQKKIIRTAEYYLQQHPDLARNACRFDVIAIDGEELEWIENAFGV